MFMGSFYPLNTKLYFMFSKCKSYALKLKNYFIILIIVIIMGKKYKSGILYANKHPNNLPKVRKPF